MTQELVWLLIEAGVRKQQEALEAAVQRQTVKCRECGGNGLDHPASYKYRNTDDDTCPRCGGTGLEPAERGE